MTPRSRRPSPKPVSSTPRRSFPLNPVLRSLSTPLRTRSRYPLLRALSTPIRRRSEYHPLVRRLCQEGAYERLPYDNDLYVAKTLRCERCHKMGTFTQNIAFKQGHAGEWVRAVRPHRHSYTSFQLIPDCQCQTPFCGLVAYPAQPGTPPDQLARIEATREATALSSTMATPDSHTYRSSASFSGNYSQDLDVTPSSIGGELEDWLSPIFWELDMESTDVRSPHLRSCVVCGLIPRSACPQLQPLLVLIEWLVHRLDQPLLRFVTYLHSAPAMKNWRVRCNSRSTTR